MAKKYDAEDLLDTVLGIMTEGDALNKKIASVDAEKSVQLSPPLKTISENSYYLQTWEDKILQTSPAIFYGIEEVTTEANGGAVAKTYKIFVEIVMVDNQMQKDASRRLARYSRALEELFADNFAPAVLGGRVKIDSVRPIAFKLAVDSDDEVKVGGISLIVAMF